MGDEQKEARKSSSHTPENQPKTNQPIDINLSGEPSIAEDGSLTGSNSIEASREIIAAPMRMKDGTPIKAVDASIETGSKYITDDIRMAVENAQMLVNYIGYQGYVDFEKENLETIILSKYLIKMNAWSSQAEIKFWQAYEELSTSIDPVTVESLKNTTVPPKQKSVGKRSKKIMTKAARAVFAYRRLTFLTLLILLMMQVYWVIGSTLHNDLMKYFEQRKAHTLQIGTILSFGQDAATEKGEELKILYRERDLATQKLNSTYELLLAWSRVWQVIFLQGQFVEEVTPYEEIRFQKELQWLETELSDFLTSHPDFISDQAAWKTLQGLEEKRETLIDDYEQNRSRNKYFMAELSSEFVLLALQAYFLPLLYGLLGASTYVLRSLAKEVKNLTYCHESEINFRLRLPLGGLAGMVIGWFLSPESASMASFSPMTLAFLLGYNVEILFTLMDKLSRKMMKTTTGK